MTFRTLRAIATAEQAADNGTIRRLVSNGAVASRMIAYGKVIRQQGVTNLHVVPSFTMGVSSPEHVAAGFFLVANRPSGHLSRQESVYLLVGDNRATVINDQPGEEW